MKPFHGMTAALQKQAAKLLLLQDVVKQQAKLIKYLTDIQLLNPRGLPDATWPLLAALNPTSSLQAPPGPVPP